MGPRQRHQVGSQHRGTPEQVTTNQQEREGVKGRKEERKSGLVKDGAQTMTMAKQNEANKAQSGAKTTTNLTAMVATYLVDGGSR